MGRHEAGEWDRRKIVVVGDGECGKTSLLLAFVENKFDEKYTPTVFETALTELEVQPGKTVQLSLWDTAGQEEYSRLRPLSYADTHVVLACFSMSNADSLDNVRHTWLPEIRHYCPKAVVLVVGCKLDVAEDPAGVGEAARRIAEAADAAGHFVCSAKTRQGVQDVFRAAACLPLKSKRRRGRDGLLGLVSCFGRRRRSPPAQRRC